LLLLSGVCVFYDELVGLKKQRFEFPAVFYMNAICKPGLRWFQNFPCRF